MRRSTSGKSPSFYLYLHSPDKVNILQLTNSRFYQERERYKLGNPRSFHYLNQSNCYELEGVSDAHDYLTTRRAMDIVGISEKEQV